jgi:hypothetical protein
LDALVVPDGATTEAKSSLLELSAATLRGESPVRSSAASFAAALASLPADPGQSPEGRWRLIYSNSTEGLFRSSPFFQTARAACSTPEEAKRFAWFCRMHRQALAISRIDQVYQVVTATNSTTSSPASSPATYTVINEFNVRVGAVPFVGKATLLGSGGLPIEIVGAIVSTGSLEPVANSTSKVDVSMSDVQVKGSNLPFSNLLLSSLKLDTTALSTLIGRVNSDYKRPKARMESVYVDGDMKIMRDVDDIHYVYSRVQDGDEPEYVRASEASAKEKERHVGGLSGVDSAPPTAASVELARTCARLSGLAPN